MTNYPWKGHEQVTWTVNHLNFSGHPPHLWNGWSYRPNGQILYACRLCQVSAYWWQMTLKRRVIWVMWPTLNFGAPTIYLERNRQTLHTCRMYHILAYRWQKETWSGSRDPFLNFATIISLESVKLGTSNVVCWLLKRCNSAGMTYYRRKGCVQGLVTSIDFGK